MFHLSDASLDKMKGVKEPLVNVVKRAIQLSEVDFKVGEGVRTLERQKALVASGKSTTMASRHLVGEAVDLWAIVDDEISWNWKYYELIAKAMKQAANELNVKLTWGGDWKSFKDGPHFQIEK